MGATENEGLGIEGVGCLIVMVTGIGVGSVAVFGACYGLHLILHALMGT